MPIQNLKDSLTRDLILLHKGDTLPCSITASLAASGWAGGQFARWVDAGTGQPTLDLANGTYCGFLVFGSNEDGDGYTAITGQNITYTYVNLTFGGNYFYTRTYERVGYMGRHGLGAATPLVYTANQVLYISENGKITTENESDTTLYPVHAFPDGSPITANSFVFFGVCSVPPSTDLTRDYIGIQTNFGV